MALVRIEHHIPPPDMVKRGRPEKYHLHLMQVGDSFWVRKKQAKYVRNKASVYKQMHAHLGWDYVTQAETHGTLHGIRLWRTA